MMAALVVMALLFGNCFSCPQMWVQDAHRCCHRNKPVTAQCDTQNLQHFVKSEARAQVSPATATAEAIEPAAVVLPSETLQFAVHLSEAPPDPLSLTSSLRI